MGGVVNVQIDGYIYRGVFDDANVFIGQKILCKRFFFVWLEPGEVWLVVGVDASHEFDVWPVFVGQVAIPGLAELAMAPCPLLFARRDMMIGNVQDTGLLRVIVAADKVVV